ncbi:MAG: ABC transporter ATP-binding protein [Selenomonadaceae bacterium]|nr:ABC transporter ATP-binding protein [Selenomonadaceae bacterium]
MSETDIIMQVEHIVKKFAAAGGKTLTACDDITFNIRKGETVAIVGESGCGKTTLLKSIMNMQMPTSGRILFHGRDITKLTGEAKRENYRHIQMVFQDPAAAFDPKMRIKEIVCEPLLNFGLIQRNGMEAKTRELLAQVELPAEFANRYPHNMSGGQRQRVAIARALALEPEIIACDEATSALDVSVQDTIVKLLVRLQKEKGITYIFICHDLALVSMFSHRIVVMYLGNMMEELDGDKLTEARHPYTRALLKAVFSTDQEKNQQIGILPGDIPSPLDLPTGCPFHNRCEYRQELCIKEKPVLREAVDNHFLACHYPLPIA